ncbi:MAG: DNA recombination protein RmuC [Xanthomonadaceae bacterium]|nr:DNA recombination protein RmuC [Xanthomonadaceae bacterium]
MDVSLGWMGLSIVLGFAAGAAIFHARGKAAGRSEREPELSARDDALLGARRERDDWRARADRLESGVEAARAAQAAGDARVSELSARLEEQQRAHARQLESLQQAEVRLGETFQNLANRVLEDRARQFGEHSEKQIGSLLDPLKLQIKEFRDVINHTHAAEQRERGVLSQQIEGLKQLNERISLDAINLTRALKGDSQAQGAWGEMVLERVLEASGLQAGREYLTQESFADGDGGRARPDVIVRLPDDKDLVIDAKVSLLAYERMVASIEPESRAAALREHVLSIKRHIDGLSGRAYTEVPGIRTLDFVLMFVPVEAAFIEAVRAEDGLYAYALGRNIALVSPSTLLATLRTVAHLWKVERRNINAIEIARRAGLLHDNFALLVDELEAIGTQLERASKAHSSALRRITEGGKGSIVLQIHALADMGAQARKALPEALRNRADSEPDSAAANADAGAGEAGTNGDAMPTSESGLE